MSKFRLFGKREFYIPTLFLGCYGIESLRLKKKQNVDSNTTLTGTEEKSINGFDSSRMVLHCQSMYDGDLKSKYNLQSVHIFFRHGARTPLTHLQGVPEVTYDKDKWMKIPEHTNVPIVVRTLDGQQKPQSKLEERYEQIQFKGGMHAGILTTLGREQAYTLGRRIKKRYINELHFIDTLYNKKQVSIRSTNVNRCIDSLQSVMGGIYGAKSFKEPVVIPVAVPSSEILFPNTRFCVTLRKLEHNTPNYLWEQDGYKFVAHYIKYFSNNKDKKDSYIGLMNWRDHDVARLAHGLEIPLWMEAIREQMHMWATKSIETFTCGLPQDRVLGLQLSAGPMLNLIVSTFDKILEKHPGTKKLYLYSCHDSSLIPLLNGLGIFDNKWPPYSADVAVELHTNEKGEYFVKMAYMDEDIILPGYDSAMIPYDKFKEMLAPYLVTPPQYNQMCHDMELARQHAKYWEAAIRSHEQEDLGEVEEEEFPPNM